MSREQDGTIPRTVPRWLEEHGTRNGKGEWIAACPQCGTRLLGDMLRADKTGAVMCVSCKAGRSRMVTW